MELIPAAVGEEPTHVAAGPAIVSVEPVPILAALIFERDRAGVGAHDGPSSIFFARSSETVSHAAEVDDETGRGDPRVPGEHGHGIPHRLAAPRNDPEDDSAIEIEMSGVGRWYRRI
jgi:hypothetical protein